MADSKLKELNAGARIGQCYWHSLQCADLIGEIRCRREDCRPSQDLPSILRISICSYTSNSCPLSFLQAQLEFHQKNHAKHWCTSMTVGEWDSRP